MLHFARWQTLGIIASVLIAILLALPNVLPTAMQDRLRPYGLRPVTLGLDLQGGINILLEIDRDDLRRRLSDQMVGDIRSSLREAKIGYNGINRFDNGVRVRISKPDWRFVICWLGRRRSGGKFFNRRDSSSVRFS